MVRGSVRSTEREKLPGKYQEERVSQLDVETGPSAVINGQF